MKSEIRNPKSDPAVAGPNLEVRSIQNRRQVQEFRGSEFGFPSVFGLRISGFGLADRAFKVLTLLMALSVFALIILIGIELTKGSHLGLLKFGWRFLSSSEWDPVNETFGALPFTFGPL